MFAAATLPRYSLVMASRSGAVHVATTRRVYKDKVYETHLLRRTYREDGKVKHETLGNVSHLPAEVIGLIRRSLAGERFYGQNDLEVVSSRAHGAVALLMGVVRRLGLDRLLGRASDPRRQRVLGMLLARILFPQSKLATARQWETTTLPEELGIQDADVDDLYAALDWLAERESAVERGLVRGRLVGKELVLYDVSSSYFTGTHCPLAKRGYSRDHRSDLPQIVYGVVTDEEGCPVAVEVFEGNTKDSSTVVAQVERLQKRHGIQRLVVVGDRGMVARTQVEAFRRQPGVDWISALTNPQVRGLLEGGSLQMSLFDERNLAEVQSPDFPGERLVACRNPALADRRAHAREELLRRTEERLRTIERSVARGRLVAASDIGERIGRAWKSDRMRKHFVVEIAEGSFHWRRDEANIAAEAALDGVYVVRTSLAADATHPADQIVRDYKRLAGVERVFRAMKTTELLVRPIFHRTPARVRAHVFLCMLAAHVLWHLERALAPLLFVDAGLQESARTRDPVAPPKRSQEGTRKCAERTSDEGHPLHSTRTLLAQVGTLARVTLRLKGAENATWDSLTIPTAWQRRVFELAQVDLV